MNPATCTLAEAKMWLQGQLEEGVMCPCCSQYARIYKRKLNSTMGYALLWLCRAYSGDWINVPKKGPRSVIATNQLGTLALWGVIEQKPNVDSRKKHSGFWRPTRQGQDFANERVMLPTHVYLYNNKVQRWSNERGDIREALGKYFDYAELMGRSSGQF